MWPTQYKDFAKGTIHFNIVYSIRLILIKISQEFNEFRVEKFSMSMRWWHSSFTSIRRNLRGKSSLKEKLGPSESFRSCATRICVLSSWYRRFYSNISLWRNRNGQWKKGKHSGGLRTSKEIATQLAICSLFSFLSFHWNDSKLTHMGFKLYLLDLTISEYLFCAISKSPDLFFQLCTQYLFHRLSSLCKIRVETNDECIKINAS